MTSALESQTLNAAVEILAAGDDNSLALRVWSESGRRQVTRGGLRRHVGQAAAAFARLGVRHQQRVVLVLPDCPEYAYAWLGSMWNGSVPVLLNSFLPPADYPPLVREAEAVAVVTTEPIAAVLHQEGFRGDKMLCVAPDGSGSFGEALRCETAIPEPFPTQADDPALWLYSSGTTGRPKAVIHRHVGVMHAISSFGRHILETRADDVAYATSKLFFAYGLGGSLYLPLVAGAATILSPEPFNAARTWRILADERPSLVFAVPSAYRALLEAAPADALAALARVRRFISAGEALPASIFLEWQRRYGAEIVDGLGSTEALHIFLSNRPGTCAPGRLDRAVPGYDIRVADERGAPVPAGVPGALRVRGDSVATGYWKRPEATERAFVDGWFITGDQAVQDADGSFRVLGRTDDLLKISGQWVSPLDVEAVIETVAGVCECAVIGRAGVNGLTELVACVVTDAASAPDVQGRIDGACAVRLPSYKRPKRVVLVERLPRTPTGKLQRAVLRNQIV